jgi:hypothetical protein
MTPWTDDQENSNRIDGTPISALKKIALISLEAKDNGE